MASVEGVFIASSAGSPMEALSAARVIAGKGIAGDRYAKGKGTFSVFRDSAKRPGEREAGRQITLVSAEGVEAGLAAAGIEQFASLADFRRNVVVRGLAASVLQAAIGHEIALGDEVIVFAHRSCVPCSYRERSTARPGLMDALWDVSGVCCEVVRGGTLRPGDAVHVLAADHPDRVDTGVQPPGFFTRPRQRTAAIHRASLAARAAALPKLLERDPEGVGRIVHSYNSVGLQIFRRPPRRADLGTRFAVMIGLFVGGLALVFATQAVHSLFAAGSTPLVSRTWWRPIFPAAPSL